MPWEFEFPLEVQGAAAERKRNTLNGFQDFRTGHGPSQGQNLALTGLHVPSSLDSGISESPISSSLDFRTLTL